MEKKTYRHFFVGNKYLYSLCLIKVDPSPKFGEVGHVTRYREGANPLISEWVNGLRITGRYKKNWMVKY